MSILVIYIAAALLYCPVVMADTPDPVEVSRIDTVSSYILIIK